MQLAARRPSLAGSGFAKLDQALVGNVRTWPMTPRENFRQVGEKWQGSPSWRGRDWESEPSNTLSPLSDQGGLGHASARRDVPQEQTDQISPQPCHALFRRS